MHLLLEDSDSRAAGMLCDLNDAKMVSTMHCGNTKKWFGGRKNSDLTQHQLMTALAGCWRRRLC
jgi:hypothetical protein